MKEEFNGISPEITDNAKKVLEKDLDGERQAPDSVGIEARGREREDLELTVSNPEGCEGVEAVGVGR